MLVLGGPASEFARRDKERTTPAQLAFPVLQGGFDLRGFDQVVIDGADPLDPLILEFEVRVYPTMCHPSYSCFNASRVGNHQPVFMHPDKAPNAVWTWEKLDGGIVRYLSTSETIPANALLVVQHRNTKQALAASTKYADLTDFGRELEVACHNYHPNHKFEALASELAGKTTGNTNARLELQDNYWRFLVATSSSLDET